MLTSVALDAFNPGALPVRYRSMPNVLWLGGPPASGKTTIATRLARRYGLRLYSADTRTWRHRDRAIAAGHAAALRWESLTPAERWERPSPAELLEMSLHRERGQMVIDDLADLPESPLIIAEGSVLPAWAVSSGVVERSRAAWLLPAPEFQGRQLAARGTVGGSAQLYRLLNEVIAREAKEHDVLTLAVDGSRGIDDTYEAVEALFASPLAAGPHAQTLSERQHLLRDINEDIITQVRGYYARPWATGDPNIVTRSFVCECANPTCDATLNLTVAEAAARPVLAH
jgi:DNA polymerase III delta prime subunit